MQDPRPTHIDAGPARPYLPINKSEPARTPKGTMMTAHDQTMTDKNVTVTDAAFARVAKVLESEPGKDALRVSVEGGGCSGFSYKFDLVAGRNDDDVVLEKDGATILVDELSLVYMGGSEIDFVDDLIGQSFQIKNPNAVASCGCGTSFTI
jgi:iron-sulfur cluster assembly accessory protein